MDKRTMELQPGYNMEYYLADEVDIKIKEVEKENERLKVFIALHGLDKIYKAMNSQEAKEQREEYLRIHGAKSR